MTTTGDSELAKEGIVDAVNRAAESVFSTMLGMSIEAQTPIEEHELELLDGVVGLIGFTGKWVGTGILFCGEQLACRIGSAMMMHECKDINADVLDGIGEMANMILGSFKETMESHTGPLGLSVPTVVYGKNFSTRTPLHAPWVIVPFLLGEDEFQVRVCIKQK